MKYPCLSTLDGPPQCMFCGRPWTVIVAMLQKFKRWENMPDCPKRVVPAAFAEKG